MIAILSPAKNISTNAVNETVNLSTPRYLSQTNFLVTHLKTFTVAELQQLYKVSKAIAQLNHLRFSTWDNTPSIAALYGFNGEVYRGLDALSLTNSRLIHLNNHVRILSGLYGVLKPLDAIHPYRLEMGTSWSPDGIGSLYKFWGSDVSKSLINDIEHSTGDKVLINLASAEYFKVVDNKGFKYPIVHVDFKQEVNGKLKNITIYAKRARGLMARFIADERIDKVDDLKAFSVEGYYFNAQNSKPGLLTFSR